MDKEDAVIAFNPLSSKEAIRFLDTPNCGIAISSFILTSLPSSSEYIAISKLYMMSEIRAHITCTSDEEWTDDWGVVELENDSSLQPCSSAPVFYQGSFYYTGKDGRLGIRNAFGQLLRKVARIGAEQ